MCLVLESYPFKADLITHLRPKEVISILRGLERCPYF